MISVSVSAAAPDPLAIAGVGAALRRPQEPRAELGALGAERQRRDEPAAGHDPAGGDHRNVDRRDDLGDQGHRADERREARRGQLEVRPVAARLRALRHDHVGARRRGVHWRRRPSPPSRAPGRPRRAPAGRPGRDRRARCSRSSRPPRGRPRPARARSAVAVAPAGRAGARAPSGPARGRAAAPPARSSPAAVAPAARSPRSGASVSARAARTAARSRSTGIPLAPNVPRPPASLTAATSSGVVGPPAMPARITGWRIPRRPHSGVVNCRATPSR